MNTVASNDPRITAIEVSDEHITAHLADGRVVSVPLAWSWRLSDATPEQRNKFEIIGDGEGVQWADVDEDISAKGMLQRSLAPPPNKQILFVGKLDVRAVWVLRLTRASSRREFIRRSATSRP